MAMSWDTERRLRWAIRHGDDDRVEEILRKERFADFDEVQQIFEDERKGRISPLGEIKYGDIEIRDRFGRPEVRRR